MTNLNLRWPFDVEIKGLCFTAKDIDSMLSYPPTKDGGWSCGVFMIMKFME
jgi:hypothetical protein